MLLAKNLYESYMRKGFLTNRTDYEYLHFRDFLDVLELENNHIEFGYDPYKYYLVVFKDTTVVLINQKAKLVTQ